jgi:hypothetical protein
MQMTGTEVPSADLSLDGGQEAFVDPEHGYALAEINSQSYPVATADGGATWRIDGPIFHVDAADGPAVVDEIAAVMPQTVLVWGEYTSNLVNVSTDGGGEWWAANLGPGVVSMGADGDQLWCVVSDRSTRIFTSVDGGRTWSTATTIGQSPSAPERG